ncbi:MAG: hypothetical protein ACR2OZ_11815 [Verrucomicrobiales bacterium]
MSHRALPHRKSAVTRRCTYVSSVRNDIRRTRTASRNRSSIRTRLITPYFIPSLPALFPFKTQDIRPPGTKKQHQKPAKCWSFGTKPTVPLRVTMAQWSGQFSGLTHESKVQDIEASLRQAVAAFDAAPEAERDSKSKAVHHLAARSKAMHARLSALREPGRKSASSSHLTQLLTRERELQAQGVTGILREFNFDDKPVA